MKRITLPPQDSAAAKLLRDIAEYGTFFPLVSELATVEAAAAELDERGGRVGLEFETARGRIGPSRASLGRSRIGFYIEQPVDFEDWCNTPGGHDWLAGVARDVPANAGSAA